VEKSVKMQGKDKFDIKLSDIVPLTKRTRLKKPAAVSSASSTCPVEGRSMSSMVDLDGTSDFSGGYTPYKAIAKNVADKQRSSNQIRKHHKIGKSKVVHEKKEQPSCDEVWVNHEKVADVMRQESGPVGDLKVCVTCGITVISSTYESHIKKCLKNRFQRTNSRGSCSRKNQGTAEHYYIK
jgi:hypothetical protein